MGQSIVRGTMVSQLGIGWWYECISHKGCAKVQMWQCFRLCSRRVLHEFGLRARVG